MRTIDHITTQGECLHGLVYHIVNGVYVVVGALKLGVAIVACGYRTPCDCLWLQFCVKSLDFKVSVRLILEFV